HGTAPREVGTELFLQRVHDRAGEAHREHEQVAVEAVLRAFDGVDAGLVELDLDGVQARDAASLALDAGRHERVLALDAFLVARGGAEHHRPLRPGVVSVARLGRLRHDLDLAHTRGALPVRRADAVRAGVAAAEHHHVLAPRVDAGGLGDGVTRDGPVPLLEVLHGEVYAVQIAALDLEVARLHRADGDKDRVVVRVERLPRDVGAHVHAGAELDAFGFEDR